MARAAHIDVEKVAKEQQIKIQREMEEILAAVKAIHGAGHATDQLTLEELTLEELTLMLTTGGKYSKVTGPGIHGCTYLFLQI